MPKSPTLNKRCPCGQNVADARSKYALAVNVAVTTLLEKPRRRGTSVTIYPCKRCINANSAMIGTAVAITLGKAVTQQIRELAQQEKQPNAKGPRASGATRKQRRAS